MTVRSVPASLVLAAALTAILAPEARAGLADVVRAQVSCQGRVCRVDATIAHADEGWQHYADNFRVLTPDGRELARRVLLHPHVDEQPFTRSQAGIEIPPGVTRLIVEAHDSVHGYGGHRVEVALPGLDVTH